MKTKQLLIPSLFLVGLMIFQVVGKEAEKTVASRDNFRIEYSDVTRFKNMIGAWKPGARVHNLKLLDKYLSAGTLGLNEFYRIKIRDTEKFADTVDALLPYYQSLSIYNYQPETLRPALTKMFSQFSQWSDEALPLDIYLVVGRFSSAGTISRNKGILIGTEHLANKISTEIFNQGFKPRPLTELLPSIAHEYTHSLQHQAGPATLIRAVIFEGGADFIAELSTGISPFNRPHYQFGLSNEKMVWNKFVKDMNGTDVSNWLANRKQKDWPADMGYYMGYQIAKAFYQNMVDKKKAFEHLTHVTDAEFILNTSGYTKRFH